jgi:hypothetical protein
MGIEYMGLKCTLFQWTGIGGREHMCNQVVWMENGVMQSNSHMVYFWMVKFSCSDSFSFAGYLYQIWFCQPWPRSCQEQNWVHDNAYKFKSIPTHAPWNIFADLIWNQLHYMREETRPNIRHTTTIRWCFHQCGKHSTSNYLPALEEVDSDSVLKPEIWCEQSFILLERVVFVTFKWAGTDSSEKNFKDKCVGQVRDRTHALLSHSASTFSHKKFKYLQTQEW